MGKVLIIKNADFSEVAVDKITPVPPKPWSSVDLDTYESTLVCNLNSNVWSTFTGWKSVVVPCKEGDKIRITVMTPISSNFRYTFLSAVGTASGQTIEYANNTKVDGTVSVSETVVDIPVGTNYFYVLRCTSSDNILVKLEKYTS